jgi:hypothetical protein
MDRTLLLIEADHKNNPFLKDHGRRVLDGMLHTASAGFWLGGKKPPLGYKVVKTPGEHGHASNGKARRRKSGLLAIDPETAPIVVELFERYRDGESTRDLTRWLTARTGVAWVRQSIGQMLRHEIYTGTRYFGLRPMGKHARLVDGQATIMFDGQADTSGDAVRLVVPALVIIKPELWSRVQERLDTGKQRGHKRDIPLNPLSGLCRCGICGQPMHSSRAGAYSYLVCGGRSRDGKEACPKSRFTRAEELFRRVTDTLAKQLLDGDAVARLVELAGMAEDEARAKWEVRQESARRAVDSCNARLKTARRRLAEEAPEDMVSEYQALIRELRQELADAEADVARLNLEQPLAEEGDAELLKRWLESCRSLCQGESPSEPDLQNAMLRELLEEVRVFPPPVLVKGKQTVGRIEVVLPPWLSRVLASEDSRTCRRSFARCS